MSTSDNTQRQARAVISKLDRAIDEARQRRTSGTGTVNGSANGDLNTVVGEPAVAAAAKKPSPERDKYDACLIFAQRHCDLAGQRAVAAAGSLGDNPTPAEIIAATGRMVAEIRTRRPDLAPQTAHFIKATSRAV